MSFKNTLESVTKDIQEIEKIISKFQNYSRIPGIELDLALQKMQNLYELLLLIKDHQASEGKIPVEKEIPKMQAPVEKEIQQPVENHPVNPEPEMKQESVKVSGELIEMEEQQELPREKPVEPKKDTAKTPKSEAVVLGEKLRQNNEFLNEKLGEGKKDKPLRIQGGPIKSIVSSLGINDRFYYIREIFDGNADSFKHSIEILDKASNFNEAYNYLKTKLIIDMDSEPVQSLLNLVRRKFITSGNE